MTTQAPTGTRRADHIVGDYRDATERLEETHFAAERMVADAGDRRARTLLRLHVQHGWTVRRIAAEVGLHPSRVGVMLGEARASGLHVRYVAGHYAGPGPLHSSCAIRRIRDGRHSGYEALPDSAEQVHAERVDGDHGLVRQLLYECAIDPDEYAARSDGAAKVSTRVRCVDCDRQLWVWEETHGLADDERVSP